MNAPLPKSVAVELPNRLTASKSLSLRALDALAFFLADVADGLGPFLAVFVTSSLGWSAGEAGWAAAAMLLGTIVSQTFVGAWIDTLEAKRTAVVSAAVVVAACCLAMVLAPSRTTILAAQFVIGVAVTVFPPAIAAISLGLVGRERLAARIGRNEGFNHAGNVAAAGLAAALAWCCGAGGVFYGVAVTAAASGIAALMLRDRDIDHRLARGADAGKGETRVVPLHELFRDRRLLWFIASVVLFHFANAAMLPLVGQKVAAKTPALAPTLMAACIIVAQLVMVPVALLAGRYANTIGRRPIFLIAFAVLPIRGLLYTLTDSAGPLIAIQLLDGIGAGVFGVIAVLMVADLTHGAGRFNFVQGLTATAVGLGAAASNVLAGLLVDAAGFNAGFVFLAAVAALGLALFATTVPESARLSAAKAKG